MQNGTQLPKMKLFSDFTGHKGRRVEQRPEFFPKTQPTKEQCGVMTEYDTADYTLHIKKTGRINWERVRALAKPTPLGRHVEQAERWCTTDASYGPSLGIDPRKIPYAAFSSEQVRELMAADKIRPHRGPIHGFVMGFTVAEHKKKRFRVIAEPFMNRTMRREEMYAVHYPSRLERRARARGARYNMEFDFAAYFDQFAIAEHLRPWFVFRVREAIEGDTLFALTRMPMGASFAPSVAQAVTSALVHPLLRLSGVHVDTMIDNVRIVATSEKQFVTAVRLFLQRVKEASITLNDVEQIEGLTDDELAARGKVTDQPRIFLGERYVGDTVANTDASVEKLREAAVRYLHRGDPQASLYTKRMFASFVGLMLFMAHTVDIPLTELHTLLRAYGRIISDVEGWDVECDITSDEVDKEIVWLADTLMHNEPVPLPVLRQPELDVEAYDIAIEVDASCEAWGAKILFTALGQVFTIQQRWTTPVSHSAHAEPRAAKAAIQWARTFGRLPNARVALLTDHIAIAGAQKRWYSNYGGFSTSFHLNECFRELYRGGGGEVFHVDGTRNEADQLSRDPNASTTLRWRRVNEGFKDLRTVVHPYREVPRLPYQV